MARKKEGKKKTVKKANTLDGLALSLEVLAKTMAQGFSEMESLAQSTARGFAAVDARFDSLGKEVCDIKLQVYQIPRELSDIRRKIDMLEERGASNAGFAVEIDELYKRVDAIEKYISEKTGN